MHKYLTYYKEFKTNRKLLRNQFEDVTKECTSYLLNILFHRDEFQKHIKVLFTIRNVTYDGNCGYHTILKSLTVIKRCTTAYNCLSLYVETCLKNCHQKTLLILSRDLWLIDMI